MGGGIITYDGDSEERGATWDNYDSSGNSENGK